MKKTKKTPVIVDKKGRLIRKNYEILKKSYEGRPEVLKKIEREVSISKRNKTRITTKTVRNKVFKKTREGSPVLVSKKGKLNIGVYEALIEKYEHDPMMQQAIRKEVDIQLRLKEPIKERTLESVLTRNKKLQLFINMGFSVEEGLEQLGVDLMTYLDEDNWDGSIFEDPTTGTEWEYIFDYYSSSAFVKVSEKEELELRKKLAREIYEERKKRKKVRT